MSGGRRHDEPASDGRRPGARGRTGDLLLAVPLGLGAALLLWFGDLHLTHRDWGNGFVLFGLGLACTFLAVRQLRRAGLVR